MAKHVKHTIPDDEDSDIHFMYKDGRALCGLSYEGSLSNPDQDFEETHETVTCYECI